MPAKSVVIENPVINSPFDEPQRHFRFGEDGITDEIILGRRQSEYFVPIASPKKRGQRVLFETEWLEERRKENEFINKVRERVTRWRQGKHVGMTKTTRALLDYWTRDGRDRRLFFHRLNADFRDAAGVHFHHRQAAAIVGYGFTYFGDVAETHEQEPGQRLKPGVGR